MFTCKPLVQRPDLAQEGGLYPTTTPGAIGGVMLDLCQQCASLSVKQEQSDWDLKYFHLNFFAWCASAILLSLIISLSCV